MSEIFDSGAQPAVVACTGLSKHFREGAEAVRVLDGIDLEVRAESASRSSARPVRARAR